MRIERTFYLDSVSTSNVQMRRVAGVTALPDDDPGAQMHQVNIVTGLNSSATASTEFWKTGTTNCVLYRVIIERLG